MSSLALISSSGRIGRGAFIVGVLIVYVLSFLSQVLLAGPVLARTGPWSFAAVQALLTWTWFVLHTRRLRDAGRGSGPAVGIAILYTLAMVLLILIVVATALAPTTMTSPAAPGAAPSDSSASSLLGFFLLLYFLALLTGNPSLGIFAYVLMAIAVLLLTPILIAFGFTIWTATRRSLAAPL